MNDTNPFGGKNKHGMYVPLTEVEVEALHRIAEAGEFKLIIKDWGHVVGFRVGKYPGPNLYKGQPLVTIGDKRISFVFRMNYQAPAIPQPNWYFDVEVWALGFRLFTQRMPTQSYGQPLQIVAGTFNDFALDIAIDTIDRDVIKSVKPRAIGLTTRHGNMRLDNAKQKLLTSTQAAEKRIREISAAEAKKVTEAMEKATKR